MTIKSIPDSGRIAISDISIEIGTPETGRRSLGQDDGRYLAGKPSGRISLSDYYGKEAVFLDRIKFTMEHREDLLGDVEGEVCKACAVVDGVEVMGTRAVSDNCDADDVLLNICTEPTCSDCDGQGTIYFEPPIRADAVRVGAQIDAHGNVQRDACVDFEYWLTDGRHFSIYSKCNNNDSDYEERTYTIPY